jgi:hypothetical protein
MLTNSGDKLHALDLGDRQLPQRLVEQPKIRTALGNRTQPWPLAAQEFFGDPLKGIGFGCMLLLAPLAFRHRQIMAGLDLAQDPGGQFTCRGQR